MLLSHMLLVVGDVCGGVVTRGALEGLLPGVRAQVFEQVRLAAVGACAQVARVILTAGRGGRAAPTGHQQGGVERPPGVGQSAGGGLQVNHSRGRSHNGHHR